MKHLSSKLLIIILAFFTTHCEREADVASYNLSKAADDFLIQRKITFYNGITGESMLVIYGRCALGNQDKARELSVTCKTSPTAYKKHFLGLSDNVTFIAEQVEDAEVNSYQYSVQFNPKAVLPDLSIRK